MLTEITLKEAITLMEKGEPVYGVNLNQEEPLLINLSRAFEGVRILADNKEKEESPENPSGGVKRKRGRRPKKEEQDMLSDEQIREIAAEIDAGKINALSKAGWSNIQIADEFGYTPKAMERILALIPTL